MQSSGRKGYTEIMKRNRQDNHRSTHQAIARRILFSPLAAFVGYPDTGDTISRGRLELERSSRGEGDVDGWTYLRVEFRRADTSCDLAFSLKNRDHWARRDLDDEGNEWVDYDLECTINHPTHGSADPATVLARVALYGEVAMLGAALAAEFKSVSRMTRTAAELAAEKSRKEEEALKSRLQELAAAQGKGMRTGSVAFVPVADVPPGNHAITLKGGSSTKEYVLRVLVPGATEAQLQRVA